MSEIKLHCSKCSINTIIIESFNKDKCRCFHCNHEDFTEEFIVGDKMDIGSKQGYPSSALSNFAPHKFIVDGVECNSMEGFLQSLKFSNPEM